MALHAKDGGYSSRKFLLALVAMVLVTLAGIAAAKWGGIAPIYPALVGGVTALYATYCGINVANSLVASKHEQVMAQVAPPAEKPADEPPER